MPAKSTSRSNERNSPHKSPESELRMDERSSMTRMSLSSSGVMPTNLSLFIAIPDDIII